MRVTVRLFALAKQKAGRPEIALELPAGATVAVLKRVMAETCPELAPLVPNLMIAVDAEYSDDERVLSAGSEIAAIPPVSGGSIESTGIGQARASHEFSPRDRAAAPGSRAAVAVPTETRPRSLR